MNNSTSTPMCLPQSRVTVIGSLTLNRAYTQGLADSTSPEFVALAKNLSETMKKSFSELSGFDSLVITHFRQGSVIAEFEMTVNANFDTTTLAEKTAALQTDNKDYNFTLETIGIVKMKIPATPVCYNKSVTIECEFNEQPETDGSWRLNSTEIVNGTEVGIQSQGKILTIASTSRIWTGTYECIFVKEKIIHKASGNLDIALLPEDVDTTLSPQFPDCTAEPKPVIPVQITYSIANSTEPYRVKSNQVEIKGVPNGNRIIYQISTTIDCKFYSTEPDAKTTISLAFENRLNQTKSIDVLIPIITKDFCEKDGDWPRAKPGYNATLQCTGGSVGKKTRECANTSGGVNYKSEQSFCVYQELHSILQEALNIQRGLGSIQANAKQIFNRMINTTSKTKEIKTYANINASVDIFSVIRDVAERSQNESKPIQVDALSDALHSASNLLDATLLEAWEPQSEGQDYKLPAKYLQSVEGLAVYTDGSVINKISFPNVDFKGCNSTDCNNTVFNVSVELSGTKGGVKILGFQSLANLLKNESRDSDRNSSSIVVSATLDEPNQTSVITMDFQLNRVRPQHHEIYCVFWNFTLSDWSSNGCSWEKTGDIPDQAICKCEHLTSFSTLMAKNPVKLAFLDEMTYVGLGVSICSLIICLVIEFLVWNSVVKSNVAHFRHTALVNISLCLLMADIMFLASAFPDKLKGQWCLISVVIKHFCYLSMFFWMLCLSIMLLHQLIFVFHQLGKKKYLIFSMCLGYLCPAVIVAVTYLLYDTGSEGKYYDKASCWLLYEGTLKGSIFAFILPVGTIVFINVFSLVVVIMKLLRPSVSEGSAFDEKETVKSILKAVIFLTPIFGITWLLGFGVLILDLTNGTFPVFVNYAFTLVNSFQGLLILLTGCIGEKKVRDALLKYVTVAKSPRSDVSTKFTSSVVKK
ncbi:adhesion G protein-coupled receptor F5 [Megalops cyprinoides]|uniref:adhesion G protein-coupled receptor F5 n=1 Tax=Megalops cyprinoides TaxID=118141 RepID=UPI001865473A|nr:adhesion G protein-coupled receptor F5 [Megalops cyprinoides]